MFIISEKTKTKNQKNKHLISTDICTAKIQQNFHLQAIQQKSSHKKTHKRGYT
jgi:hypothetical protein